MAMELLKCLILILLSVYLLPCYPQVPSFVKPTICLNMIVKNESHVICRALASALPFIDYWVIVDTGSTDGTQELILSTLQHIPGRLYERPWVDFMTNRNEALLLAQGCADYLIFLDADDWLDYPQNYNLPPLSADCYYAQWRSPGCSYNKPLIVKTSLPWRWEGVLHEYITCPSHFSTDKLYNLHYVFTAEGHRSKDPEKYLKAARILEQALIKEPTNSRYVFYLAESYRDAGLLEKALETYHHRTLMKGWEEEIFWSLLQMAHLKSQLHCCDEAILAAYYAAHAYQPARPEPVYYLAAIYNQKQHYALSYACIKTWQKLLHKPTTPRLFQQPWTADYGIPCQLSLAAYYVGNYEESLQLHDDLLHIPTLPESWREHVLYNRQFLRDKIPPPQELLSEQ